MSHSYAKVFRGTTVITNYHSTMWRILDYPGSVMWRQRCCQVNEGDTAYYEQCRLDPTFGIMKLRMRTLGLDKGICK